MVDMIQILRKEGWVLNPNDKVVNAILKRCEKNEGLCPCVHDSEDYDGKDLHCPCTDYTIRVNVNVDYMLRIVIGII